MLDGRLLLIALVVATVMIGPSAAAEGSCVNGTQPAATLLFPYFEIHPEAEASLTTLMSVGNVSNGPILAQVVVWTNCGVPVLDFTLYLGDGAIQSLDLRKVVVDGQIPVTGPGGGANPFPSCTDPLSQPLLDATALARIRARLSGQPSPDDGLCYAHPDENPTLINGYVTVDVLNDCSETIRTPDDEGYFESGGQGLASNQNALWGDFYLVDGSGNTAKGFEAVSVVADAAFFAGPFHRSFYANGDGDDRLPLSSSYRTRFLRGGGFDGGTEIIAWAQLPTYSDGPFTPPCESGCQGLVTVDIFARNERGETLGNSRIFPPSFPIKMKVGSNFLPVPLEGTFFGSIDISIEEECGVCSPPYFFPVQGWVMTLHSATGRFGVGLNAVRLDDSCE